MKDTIQMANNHLYSLPCWHNKNDMHYDLKQEFSKAEPQTKLALRTQQEGPSVRALSCSAFCFLFLLPYFVRISASVCGEASGEDGQEVLSSLGCVHFLVLVEPAPCLPSGMVSLFRPLAEADHLFWGIAS